MIKFLLIAGLVGLAILELRGRAGAGHIAARRVVACLILLLGIAGVLFPLAVTRVANFVGVGRGTDLVLYALVIAFLFSTLGLYQRLARLENRYVEVSRALAIEEALRLENGRPADEDGQASQQTGMGPERIVS
jgi:hypothetical protein